MRAGIYAESASKQNCAGLRQAERDDSSIAIQPAATSLVPAAVIAGLDDQGNEDGEQVQMTAYRQGDLSSFSFVRFVV